MNSRTVLKNTPTMVLNFTSHLTIVSLENNQEEQESSLPRDMGIKVLLGGPQIIVENKFAIDRKTEEK